jgi:hypothetical protein
MILKPCVFCFPDLVKNCKLKPQKLAALRGQNFTTATFKCPILKDILEPGTRVSAIFILQEESGRDLDGGPIIHEWKEEIKGTIMSLLAAGKVKIWLDEALAVGEDNKRAIVRLYPKRLTILDEAKKKVCPACGRPEDQENINFFCEECSGVSWVEYAGLKGLPF